MNDLRSIVRSSDDELFRRLYHDYTSTPEGKWMLMREIDVAIDEMQCITQGLIESINKEVNQDKATLLTTRLTHERELLGRVYTRRHILLATLSLPSTHPPTHIESFTNPSSASNLHMSSEEKKSMEVNIPSETIDILNNNNEVEIKKDGITKLEESLSQLNDFDLSSVVPANSLLHTIHQTISNEEVIAPMPRTRTTVSPQESSTVTNGHIIANESSSAVEDHSIASSDQSYTSTVRTVQTPSLIQESASIVSEGKREDVFGISIDIVEKREEEMESSEESSIDTVVDQGDMETCLQKGSDEEWITIQEDEINEAKEEQNKSNDLIIQQSEEIPTRERRSGSVIISNIDYVTSQILIDGAMNKEKTIGVVNHSSSAQMTKAASLTAQSSSSSSSIEMKKAASVTVQSQSSSSSSSAVEVKKAASLTVQSQSQSSSSVEMKKAASVSVQSQSSSTSHSSSTTTSTTTTQSFATVSQSSQAAICEEKIIELEKENYVYEGVKVASTEEVGYIVGAIERKYVLEEIDIIPIIQYNGPSSISEIVLSTSGYESCELERGRLELDNVILEERKALSQASLYTIDKTELVIQKQEVVTEEITEVVTTNEIEQVEVIESTVTEIEEIEEVVEVEEVEEESEEEGMFEEFWEEVVHTTYTEERQKNRRSYDERYHERRSREEYEETYRNRRWTEEEYQYNEKIRRENDMKGSLIHQMIQLVNVIATKDEDTKEHNHELGFRQSSEALTESTTQGQDLGFRQSTEIVTDSKSQEQELGFRQSSEFLTESKTQNQELGFRQSSEFLTESKTQDLELGFRESSEVVTESKTQGQELGFRQSTEIVTDSKIQVQELGFRESSEVLTDSKTQGQELGFHQSTEIVTESITHAQQLSEELAESNELGFRKEEIVDRAVKDIEDIVHPLTVIEVQPIQEENETSEKIIVNEIIHHVITDEITETIRHIGQEVKEIHEIQSTVEENIGVMKKEEALVIPEIRIEENTVEMKNEEYDHHSISVDETSETMTETITQSNTHHINQSTEIHHVEESSIDENGNVMTPVQNEEEVYEKKGNVELIEAVDVTEVLIRPIEETKTVQVVADMKRVKSTELVYDIVHEEEESIYEEISESIFTKNSQYFEKIVESVSERLLSKEKIELIPTPPITPIQTIAPIQHLVESRKYAEISEEVIMEKKVGEEVVYDRVCNEEELAIEIPRYEPRKRGHGSFVEAMAEMWGKKIAEEEEKKASPGRIGAPKRKDFGAEDCAYHFMVDDSIQRPTDLDSAAVRSAVRPRSRSLCSPSPLYDIETPSLRTIRYDSIEGRTEKSKKEMDDFYLGDVTVVTNEGVHLTEKNPYDRNEYEEVMKEVILSPQLEKEAQTTLHTIRTASKYNRWEDIEHSKEIGHRQYSRSLSSPLSQDSFRSGTSSSHSRKKSVTFAPDPKLVDYGDMHSVLTHKETSKSTVERMNTRIDDVRLVQAEDVYTRKELNNGNSLLHHYERIETRQPLYHTHSLDQKGDVSSHHTSKSNVHRHSNGDSKCELHSPPIKSIPSPMYKSSSDTHYSSSVSSSKINEKSHDTASINNNQYERVTHTSPIYDTIADDGYVRLYSPSSTSSTPSLPPISSIPQNRSSIYDIPPHDDNLSISTVKTTEGSGYGSSNQSSIDSRRVSTDTVKTLGSNVSSSSSSTLTSHTQIDLSHGEVKKAVIVSKEPINNAIIVSSQPINKQHSIPPLSLSSSSITSISHPPSPSFNYLQSSSINSSPKENSSHTHTSTMRVDTGEVQLNGDATIQMDTKFISNASNSSSSPISQWDPTELIKRLYEVSYEPRMETKRNRFINMEGHVEIPNEEHTDEGFERKWVPKYVKTRDGRLQFFVTHYSDETPAEEKLLSGADVETSREERTLRIIGGRAHLKITLRVPSGVLDKWRQALLSHAASSSIDAYVRPIPSTLPHIKQRVVLIELGSCSIRGGLLTSEPSLPTSFFPSIGCILPNGEVVVGAEAYAPKNRLNGELHPPLTVNGPSMETYSMNVQVMKACIRKILIDNNADPTRHKVLLSIPQNIPSVLIEDLMRLLLEDIKFQAAAVTRLPSLVLYAYDVTTGVVVDIGDRLSIVPVVDGYMVENSIVSLSCGSRQMRECLRKQLSDNNKAVYSFDSPLENLILRNVMEETCFVPQDAEEEKLRAKSVMVSLMQYNILPSMPKTVQVDNSRFLATEGLFIPKKWGMEGKGLHQLIHESIQNSPIDSRRTLYRNIYLSGGTSLLPGLAERLETELSKIVPNTIHSQVHISPWRYNAAFLGAQVVASSATFDDSCITLSTLPSFLSNLRSSS